MDFGSLPSEILRLILPSQGKAACVAAQVCSSWRTFLQSHFLQCDGASQSLPNWCLRWQISDLSEANFAFATLCRIQPQLLHFADAYGHDGELLTALDTASVRHQDISNHILLGQPMDASSFRFFNSLSVAESNWKNVALMELWFGDDRARMESWWLLVEARLHAKQHAAFILQSLRFGSSWQNLYRHASLLSPEVIPTPPRASLFARQHAPLTASFAFYRLAFCICFTMDRATVLRATHDLTVKRNLGTGHLSKACKATVRRIHAAPFLVREISMF
jgi:hypothetical protein